MRWKRRQCKVINVRPRNMKYQNMECKKLISEGAKTSRICIASITALICIAVIIFLLIFLHPTFFNINEIFDDDKDGNYTTLAHNDTLFLLNPMHLCMSSDQAIAKNNVPVIGNLDVKALVLITSAPKHADLRQAIRQTWGSLGRHKETSIRIAFVIGTSPFNTTLSKLIKKENFLNKDIIQPDIEDSERNRAYKSAALLRWAAEYCPKAHYIIKAEDDTFVDMDFLLKTLTHDEKYKNKTQFIGSYVEQTEDDNTKTTNQTYEMTFPASGGSRQPHVESTYLISQCALQPLKQLIISNENSFSLSEKLLNQFGITLIGDDRLWRHPPPQEWVQFQGLISAHGYDPLGMTSLWQQFQDDAVARLIQLDSMVDESSPNYCSQ